MDKLTEKKEEKETSNIPTTCPAVFGVCSGCKRIALEIRNMKKMQFLQNVRIIKLFKKR